ncbi:glycosyltransferase [Chryseobacterium sp. SNU WT5]|uniref:glycosyltransferase n=1 Tax=Chryseobacterium sp. SNU WT5 TaxID=2594269 RepID=UPI00118154DA|nr:glycosyltransferase [Chryseobacterium sp. SNU WT5]QDP85819.1 glycosyltransferase [Chryseobacterium sp. SNU WT5]
MNDKISIIVPVYNVEKYLPQCMDSIIFQTYQNLEIILVDDGSTDSCPQICDDYALKDERVRVIHQKNTGVAVARNMGLGILTGDFVAFVDPDDILAPHFYENMLRCLIENNADIVECDFINFTSEIDITLDLSSVAIREKIYDAEKALELLMKEEIKQMPWNKLLTAEICKGVLFPAGKKHEDDFWAYQIFGNAKKIIKRDEILYFYRQHNESNMGRQYNLTRLDGLSAIENRIEYIQNHFPNLETLAINKFCFGSLWHYQQIENNPELDPQMICRSKILEDVKGYNKWSLIKQWKLKEIFWYQFFINAPNICIGFRNLINKGK